MAARPLASWTEPTHRVPGAHGVRLAVIERGEPGGIPVIFLHGFSLSADVWASQLASPALAHLRLVAPDLRGHGDSDAPSGDAAYTDRSCWAGDISAIIEALGLDRPVIVAWSYGGLVLGDYLSLATQRRCRAVVLVAAALRLGPLPSLPAGDPFFDLIPALVAQDAGDRADAEELFVDRLVASPLEPVFRQRILARSRLVRPDVRRALIERVVDPTPAFRGLSIPSLVIHGDRDVLLPPVVSDLNAELVGGTASRFAQSGHAPFIEEPDRFNAELAAFVERTAA